MEKEIASFIQPGREISHNGIFLSVPIKRVSEAIVANANYYGNQQWAEEYLQYVHRSEEFKDRWQMAMGDWNGKIVVDIGCGPGNVYATMQGRPAVIIGVDIAPKSLEMAGKLGYIPLMADAAELPLISSFADIVILNATLHHCDDMEAVLKEASRLVKPGGLLITDQDPQLSAWNYKGVARLLWNARIFIYRLFRKGFHRGNSQQYWGLACEVHHKPGDGLTNEFFMNTLQPLGFKVDVLAHNNTAGARILEGETGRAALKYQLGNLLSGRNPFSKKSAITLMCIARQRKG